MGIGRARGLLYRGKRSFEASWSHPDAGMLENGVEVCLRVGEGLAERAEVPVVSSGRNRCFVRMEGPVRSELYLRPTAGRKQGIVETHFRELLEHLAPLAGGTDLTVATTSLFLQLPSLQVLKVFRESHLSISYYR